MDKIKNKSQKYKNSRFNVEIKKDDAWIIFNTFTHGMLELNEKYYKIYKNFYIENPKIEEKNEKNYYKKILRNPFSGERLNCKVLPWCMGGCFLLETKKLEKCIPEKYILNDLIKLYYEEATINEKNSRV
ncbi:hypothetical protein [Marinitoga lauensis]|uniref:hypothetical protein n=1 Tax=Marinitoga lauensis TaxID=2201189 RepID=UPI001010778A|nr:hypothetical protein [Marinitoga lauensis]